MTSTQVSETAEASRPPVQKHDAILLSTYVDKHFGGDPLSLSKATKAQGQGISTMQINRWIENNAVIADGTVYLKASSFPEKPMQAKQRMKRLTEGVSGEDLADHIRCVYRFKNAFAETHGILQQQISRWTSKKCLFLTGQVYRMQRQLVDGLSLKGKEVSTTKH